MESLRDFSVKITDSEYHAHPAWCYSTIARYAKDGFQSISTLREPVKPTPSMEFGSLFDTIITKGDTALDEYSICSITVPEAERKALDYISSMTDKPRLDLGELPESQITALCDACGYQTRWGYDARIRHLLPYSVYYDTKRTGKRIVSLDDWNDAIEMERALRGNRHLAELFGKEDTGDVEYIYQAKYIEDYMMDDGEVINVKIMPDLVVVNHKEKTIQPVDLKTSVMPAYDWADNFIKYRYDLQAELYTDIIRLVANKSGDYDSYSILPYIFVDISRSDKVPVSWVYDPSNGFSYTRNGVEYRYKGWEELLREIMSYERSGAVVPSHIKTDSPNDVVGVLSGTR